MDKHTDVWGDDGSEEAELRWCGRVVAWTLVKCLR